MELEAEPLPEPLQEPSLEPTVPPPEETVSPWRRVSEDEKGRPSGIQYAMECWTSWELPQQKEMEDKVETRLLQSDMTLTKKLEQVTEF